MEKWSLSSFSDAFCCQPPNDPSSSSVVLGRCSLNQSNLRGQHKSGAGQPALALLLRTMRQVLCTWRSDFRDAFLAPQPRCLPNWPNEPLGRVSKQCGGPNHPCAVESAHAVVMALGECLPQFWSHGAHDEIGARRGAETEQQSSRLKIFDQRDSLQQHARARLFSSPTRTSHEFNLTNRKTQHDQTLFDVSAGWCHLSTQLLWGRPTWLPRSVLRTHLHTCLRGSTLWSSRGS